MNIRHLALALLSLLPLHAEPDGALPPPPLSYRIPSSENNPLLEISKPLEWSRLLPDQIHADIDAAMRKYIERIRTAETVEKPTYDNTLLIFLENATLMDAFYRAEVLIRLRDSPEHRKLATELDKKYNQVKEALFHNEHIWPILKKMVTQDWMRRQYAGRHHFITRFMAEFRDNGADLPPDQQAQFIIRENELAALKRQFAANLADAQAAWTFDITDYKILDKLPPEYVKQENGRRFLRYHIAETILGICPDEKLREALWRSLQTIGKESHDNSDLIRRILAVRQKQAEVLGYANHADRIASRCSINTGAKAAEYVRNSLQRLHPAYVRNMKCLQDIKAQLTENPQAELAPWDVPYYSYILSSIYLKHFVDFDKMLTSDMVLQRIFDRLSHMYGITFSERTTVYLEPGSNKKAPAGTVEVWHPGVRYFEITDKTSNARRGAIYLDLEYRENKETGIWTIPVTTYPHPLQKVHCSVISSSHGIQALMYPAGIQHMLHELGHVLHRFMSNTEQDYLGFQTSVDDFDEFTATLHANLAKRRDVLTSLMQPALTTEAYLDYNNLKEYEDIQTQFRILCESLLDLEIHMHGNLDVSQDLAASEKEILRDYLYLTPQGENLTEYLPFCRNTFIFAGGYSGLYYTYFRSEELATCARHRFFDESMRFRQTFLEKGYSKPASELYGNFMGIDPSPASIQRYLYLDPDLEYPENVETTPAPIKP